MSDSTYVCRQAVGRTVPVPTLRSGAFIALTCVCRACMPLLLLFKGRADSCTGLSHGAVQVRPIHAGDVRLATVSISSFCRHQRESGGARRRESRLTSS